MKVFVLLLIMLFQCGILTSADPRDDNVGQTVAISPELFEKASAKYLEGDYDSAISLYEKLILETGRVSGNIYYNLGNSQLSAGKLGPAMVSYERARIFIPADSDLKANHRYAKTLMKQQDPFEEKTLLGTVLRDLFAGIPIRSMYMILLLLYYGLIVFILTAKIYRKAGFWANLAIIVWVLAITGVAVPLRDKVRDIETAAIVTAQLTDARYEPSREAMIHFPLYEGMRINILRKDGSWYRIRRPDGRIGWVRADGISTIKPL